MPIKAGCTCCMCSPHLYKHDDKGNFLTNKFGTPLKVPPPGVQTKVCPNCDQELDAANPFYTVKIFDKKKELVAVEVCMECDSNSAKCNFCHQKFYYSSSYDYTSAHGVICQECKAKEVMLDCACGRTWIERMDAHKLMVNVVSGAVYCDDCVPDSYRIKERNIRLAPYGEHKQEAEMPGYINPKKLYAWCDYTPDMIGGKAASLVRLMQFGTVPDAWVIPTKYTFARGPVYLENIPKDGLYAVRSGAKISMPGMMETKLNVRWEDLPAAIEAVWDSYSSDHCKAYRAAKNIPDDIGTAVTIQKMVRPVGINAMIAGVAFTADPSDSSKANEYNPIIEYVEGLGDALVGGTAQPERLPTWHPVYPALTQTLKAIHDIHGASDVEWAYNGLRLYLLQQRGVKFAPKVELIKDLGEMLLVGRSIGAPVTITAEVAKDANDAEGKIFYAEDFKPEYYEAMMAAAAIVCLHGGETCHASIVSRELGKPAISGIGQEAFNLLPKTLTVCGQSGSLHEPLPDAVVERKRRRVTETKLDPARLPDFSVRRKVHSVNSMLARFYYLLDAAQKGKISAETKDREVQKIADVLATYLYISTICEARWAYGCSDAASTAYKQVEDLEAFYDITLNVSRGDDNSRNQFAKSVPEPGSIKEASEIIKLVKEIFDIPKWRSSYGGKKWGIIAGLLLDYLTGKLSVTMFVDGCFNLQHNGGAAFNKFSWLVYDESLLQKQLDTKRNSSVEKLVNLTVSRGYSVETEEEMEDIGEETEEEVEAEAF